MSTRYTVLSILSQVCDCHESLKMRQGRPEPAPELPRKRSWKRGRRRAAGATPRLHSARHEQLALSPKESPGPHRGLPSWSLPPPQRSFLVNLQARPASICYPDIVSRGPAARLLETSRCHHTHLSLAEPRGGTQLPPWWTPGLAAAIPGAMAQGDLVPASPAGGLPQAEAKVGTTFCLRSLLPHHAA